MNKELCFIIENKSLYLEQVLVDYRDIPIFFLCKDAEQIYIALCTDLDELNYIVVKMSLSDTYNLLHGNIPMRDIILKQKEYWEVVSGDEVILDSVTKLSIDMIDCSVLPEKNACFKILTKQIELYVQKFDEEFLSAKYFLKSDKKVNIDETLLDHMMDRLFGNMNQFTELAEYKVEKTVFSKSELSDGFMENVKYTEVISRNSRELKQCKMDGSFKLAELSAINMIIAA